MNKVTKFLTSQNIEFITEPGGCLLVSQEGRKIRIYSSSVDVIYNGGHSSYNFKTKNEIVDHLKKVLNREHIADELNWGGNRPGSGRKKETPTEAKRRSITVTDEEYTKIQEDIKAMRSEE
jgi:hypothetical protein